MRIDRKAISETITPKIYLLKAQNERFLKWEKLVFGENGNNLQDDFSARIPLSLLFAVLLFVASVNLIFQSYRYLLFANQAVSGFAELVNKESSSLGDSQQYYLSYRYNYWAETFTKTNRVNQSDYENAIIGTRYSVLLIANNPDLIIGSMNEVLFPLLISGIFLIVVLAIALVCFYRWYRKIWLIPAKITEVEQGEKHTNRGVHQTFEISYEFNSPKTKMLLKGRVNIPLRQNAPTSEQLLAIFYRNDTDFLAL